MLKDTSVTCNGAWTGLDTFQSSFLQAFGLDLLFLLLGESVKTLRKYRL